MNQNKNKEPFEYKDEEDIYKLMFGDPACGKRCNFEPCPFNFCKVFTILLRNYYADPENNLSAYDKQFLLGMKYSDDIKERKINIDIKARNDTDQTDLRAAIFVSCSGLKLEKFVISDYVEDGEENHEQDFASDKTVKKRSKKAGVTVTMTHIAKSYDEATQFAYSTTMYLMTIEHILQDGIGLEKIETDGSKEAELFKQDTGDTRYKAEVTVNISFFVNYDEEVECRRIKRVSVVVNPKITSALTDIGANDEFSVDQRL